MSVTLKRVREAMDLSVECSSGFQSIVRDYIERRQATCLTGEIARDIADLVSEFKSHHKEHAKTLWPDQKDPGFSSYNKAVNNIINDISRICREELGFSIVCTSRKSSIYQAMTPKPRKPSVKVTGAPAVEKHLRELSETESVDAVIKMIRERPTNVLTALINHHGWETVGKLVVPLMQKAKEGSL